MKQYAVYWKSFCLEPSHETFHWGLGQLTLACDAAREIIVAAQAVYGNSVTLNPTSDRPWNSELREDSERIRLELALLLYATHDWDGGSKVKAKGSPGKFEYTTPSGLTFCWRRGPETKGRYAFFVIHPTGHFEEGSTLRASLEQHGWEIGDE